MRLVHTCGDWKEEAKLTVAMQSDDAKIGVIALGARKGGEEYTTQDRDVLQQTADWVVRALSLAKRDN